MRDLSAWKDKLRKSLADQWPSDFEHFSPAQMCDVELGLALLSAISPKSRAQSLWALLTGYPFPSTEVASWSDNQHSALGIARHLLPYYRSGYQWSQAVKSYQSVPEILRGYEIDTEGRISQRVVSVAAERFQVYTRTLTQAVKYRKESLRWASAGNCKFDNRGFLSSVSVPDDLIQPPFTGHTLTGPASKPSIDVSWSDIVETARWIDAQSQACGLEVLNYTGRIERVRLEMFSADKQTLHVADCLTIKGVIHLIGMVSSGKSTLMDVLSVWAARQGLHVTLVVGDVVSALNRAQFFRALGLSAAPVLGKSNRMRHLNRLHRLLNVEQSGSPLSQQHVGFRWLSTICLLDGLRDDPLPLEIDREPCLGLYAHTDEDETNGRAYACPLYSTCPGHQAQRDLVDAKIWVATPASLIYTRVAAQLNPERLRFLELVYRRSDLVIVDEADQVQVQLDTMFSPSQTLMGRSFEAWLSQIQQAVTSQLNLEGRGQLRQAEVDVWCQAHDVAQSATNRIYGLLLRNQQLRRWVEKGDYFNDLTLLDNLAQDLGKLAPTASTSSTEATNRWWQEFEEYLQDPLGERRPHSLATLSHLLLAVTSEDQRRAALATWIRSQSFAGTPPTEDLETLAQELELALLVSILQDRLDFILRRWRQVEAILRLEGGGGALLFQRPPDDYSAVIPATPMGNVLAFQYSRANDQPANTPGELRFFRCMGVGRWILLKLPTLFAADGVAGPNTLLLSGTSWAGTSPKFHVQVPVAGILRAPDHEVEAIRQSRFSYKPVNDEKTARPIRVSGLKGADRFNALKSMAHELARRSRAGGESLLERERQGLPTKRQRILMLVGSYEEAKIVYRYLTEELRPDWKGQISYLVPDDNHFDSEWRTGEESDKGTLQRGLVYRFAETEAWLLIAPLLAVERGHNILNDQQQAALGAVYFMVRPHPRPNDINYAIHSINQWAVEHHANQSWLRSVAPEMTWEAIGDAFRDKGFRRWRELLKLPMIYSVLEVDERDAVTWGQLVSIWQVIGRLVRGGSPARVVFCDAAFAPNLTDDAEQSSQTPSLLLEMRRILSPYFENPDQPDSALVKALYEPLYAAIKQMQGVPTNAPL